MKDKKLRFKVYFEGQNIFDLKTNDVKEAKKKFKSVFDKFK